MVLILVVTDTSIDEGVREVGRMREKRKATKNAVDIVDNSFY
jgi:hypothetical protein